VSITGTPAVPVSNSAQTVAYIQPGLATSIRNAANSGSATLPGNYSQCVSQADSGSDRVAQGFLRFSENFGNAFKFRTNAQNGQGLGIIQAGNNAPTNESVPGQIMNNTESGFFLPGYSSGQYVAGLADSGTRLKAVFNNVPAGVRVYVGFPNYITTTPSTVSANSYAQLVATTASGEAAADYSGLPSVTTGTDTISGGPAVELQVISGQAVAVWEVVASLPYQLENFDFAWAIRYTANPLTNLPAPGTGVVNLSFAPISTPIPRFGDTSTAISLYTISACRVLLTTAASPAAGGTVGAAPSSVDSYYNYGQSVQLTANANGGYTFANWSGDLTGTANPGTVVMNGPRTVTANFVVNNPVPVLSIAKTHTGNFTQGQSNAVYTVVVSNQAGAGPTNGMVTVTETAPSGLSLVSMSGTDWTCVTNTCTRSDALNAGSNYPAITVVVNVALNAPSSVINQVSVFGGGSATANATNSTIINALQPSRIGAYTTGRWQLDINGNGAFDAGTDRDFFLGWPGTTIVTGDWNGDGKTKVGVYSNGYWFLDYDGNGVWDGGVNDKLVAWGWAGATPVVGDWNGDGKTKIGVYANGFWFLDYNGDYLWDGGVVDKQVGWGWAGVTPIVGDWNGNGKTKIGVYANGYWFLDYDGNYLWDGGVVDKQVGWGWAGVTPIVGDWNGDGRTKIGVYAGGYWYLDYDGNYLWEYPAKDKIWALGWPGTTPVMGDWNGDGKTKAGAFINGYWYLDYNGNGAWDGSGTDRIYAFGSPGDVPVVGRW
jgi:hypothetical protein